MRTLIKNIQLIDSKETAVVIKDGLIEDLFLEAPRGSFDEVVDGKQCTLLPGFNDAHGHFLGLSYMAKQIDVTGIHTFDALKETLLASKREVIRGAHFYESAYETKKLLTKSELDQVSTKKPVLILRACGHVLMANQVAIDHALSYHQEMPSHLNFNFEAGHFFESAVSFMLAPYLNPSLEELISDIKASEAHALSYGVTSFQSDDFITYPIDFERIMDAFKVAGPELKLRLYEQAHLKTLDDLNRFIKKGYVKKSFGRITMGPSKLLIDGSLGAKTAYMKKPYQGTHEVGLLNYDLKTLKAYIKKLNEVSMDFAWHAIGDQASAHILKALEEVSVRKNHRHAIIHAQLTGLEEITKMKSMNVGAMIQPVFLDDDIPILEDFLGDKAKDTYLFKTLYDSVQTAMSTDAPIVSLNPFLNMYHAITRSSLKHPLEKPHLKEEALTFKDALEGYTRKSAYFMYQEKHLGSIKKGYIADLILVKDFDIHHVDSLLNARVIKTMIEGTWVYESSFE